MSATGPRLVGRRWGGPGGRKRTTNEDRISGGKTLTARLSVETATTGTSDVISKSTPRF